MQFRTITAVLAVLAAVSAAAPASAECVFAKLAEMPVDMSQGRPRVQIEAGGQKRWVLLATGGHNSTLTRSAIAALGGKVTGEAGVSSVGRGASGGRLIYALVPNVAVGGAFRIPSMEVLVGEDEPGAGPDDIAGYLGADILAAADVEFDLANKRVTFFQPKDCKKDNLGYWGGAISETPMTNAIASGQRISLFTIVYRPKVALNGRTVMAELNSTSSTSIVDSTMASVLGLKPGGPGVKKAKTTSANPPWVGQFETFDIGGEQIKNPSFVLRELYAGTEYQPTASKLSVKMDTLPKMILGLDFIASHRILVANSQQKIYFSYNGGPVFKTPPIEP
jgi:hypothetical protein